MSIDDDLPWFRNLGFFLTCGAVLVSDSVRMHRAERIAEELAKGNSSNTLLNYYWLASIRAAIQLDRKNPGNAIELLQPAATYDFGSDNTLQLGTMYPAFIGGEAYLGERQSAAAAAEFQKFLDHRGVVVNHPLAALAHLGLARAYVLRGDIGEARTAYQDFLALWKDADPDIPILKQAQSRVRSCNRLRPLIARSGGDIATLTRLWSFPGREVRAMD